MVLLDIPPAQLETPPAIVVPAKRRGRRERRGSRGTTTAIAIGTILILSDGSECRVTHIDANGQPWCVPVSTETKN